MKNIFLSILITIAIASLFYFINLHFTKQYEVKIINEQEICKTQQVNLQNQLKVLEAKYNDIYKKNTKLETQSKQIQTQGKLDAEIWSLQETIRNLKLENQNLKEQLNSLQFDENKFQNKKLKIEIN